MSHDHHELETSIIVIAIPGDVALSLVNSMTWMEEHHHTQDIMFCDGEETVDRYAQFRDELRQKVEKKFKPLKDAGELGD